ncbi:Xaa-Pro dipeptidase [Dyadobacter sp. CECT 9275]|uniref:Xaa-Pro aminopeptidase n=1 Tax=Dyadobacter helix TaxID=2822344 RepID=A0A916JFJ5_9BACT|nr:aminopeptidase P family protein [Dyadobacter sp. CECT 9275]CAG5008229.1 Xaa-Pro dipeptidase [Dyadobacter sp. CECT 9275]
MKRFFTFLFVLAVLADSFGQLPVPADFPGKDFHRERREAMRRLMPSNSVVAVFSYPQRNFSNDTDYKYHANPDLYYFTGYTEPSAVLLLFKEAQQDSAGKAYSELFFVQQRNPAREQWTGKRLGVEGVKETLGFSDVYNSTDLGRYLPDLAKFDKIIFEFPQDLADKIGQTDDAFDLVKIFRKKAAIPDDYDAEVLAEIASLLEYPGATSPEVLPNLIRYYTSIAGSSERHQQNSFAQRLLNVKQPAELSTLMEDIRSLKWNTSFYRLYTSQLRQIKTTEEIRLMKKAIDISALAHNEAMKAVKPGMSELELQGIQEFIHKKLGAEYVGYPSIVGAGANGCVLHYVENNATEVGNRLVLMDIGAEYHGYTADVTRTFPASGKFTSEQKQIYDIVYQAQEAVFKICKEGTTFKEIEETARKVVGQGLVKLGIIKSETENRLYYPHGCSHFLGLDVHDKGIYKGLLENMIITVEPGIYIPEGSDCDKKWWGIAVRIEDDVLIGKQKGEILSLLAPRSTEEVEKMAAQRSFVDQMVIDIKK